MEAEVGGMALNVLRMLCHDLLASNVTGDLSLDVSDADKFVSVPAVKVAMQKAPNAEFNRLATGSEFVQAVAKLAGLESSSLVKVGSPAHSPRLFDSVPSGGHHNPQGHSAGHLAKEGSWKCQCGLPDRGRFRL